MLGEDNVRNITFEEKDKRIILGLDVSTKCIGVSIIIDEGKEKPTIVQITHITPKVPKGVKGIEELFLKKRIFENEFLSTITNVGITDVIIEEPLLTSNNAYVVATLLRFNGMISDSIYEKLGVVPRFISSYDARMFAFPQLCAIRKYNRKGEEYPQTRIRKDLTDGNVVLFGNYPYDIDKKVIVMDMVNEMYDGMIEWKINKKGKLMKENYDACDSLVCALAYVNINHHGIEKPTIPMFHISNVDNGYHIEYQLKIWKTTFNKILDLTC